MQQSKLQSEKGGKYWLSHTSPLKEFPLIKITLEMKFFSQLSATLIMGIISETLTIYLQIRMCIRVRFQNCNHSTQKLTVNRTESSKSPSTMSLNIA